MKEQTADIVIIGGSVGGVAAALAACRLGKKVILTEECAWIGGQLTNQAVPPDEHQWIEQFGATRSYRDYREQVRRYYRTFFPLTADAAVQPLLNPGNALVSRISHDPRVAHAVLQAMLAPYEHSGLAAYFYRLEGFRMRSGQRSGQSGHGYAAGQRRPNGLVRPFRAGRDGMRRLAPACLSIDYVTGAESRLETGEPHALEGAADPMDMQAVTHCFAVDYLEGEDHTIDKPKDYEFWRQYQADFWPERQLSWFSPQPRTLKKVEYALFPRDGLFSLWNYRRIIDKELFREGAFASDITIVNWPQNDYWLGPVIDVPEEERLRHLEGARQLSLSLLYWMQTEAPRPDGKQGYPGLRLRADVCGTDDGLAQQVYIRESRRIRARFTVKEQHVNPDCTGTKLAAPFRDSVGIGFYHIDLHPSTAGRNYIDVESVPFQIPLGSLIPEQGGNLLLGLQKYRDDPHYERLLPPAPGGMEYRRGGGFAGCILPESRVDALGCS